MPADVNVTEKVARALYEHRLATGDFVDGPTAWDDLPEPWRDEWREGAAAALAALSDPEVLAGMAGVLREHGLVRGAYRDPSYGPGIVCRCGAVVDQALDETMQETQARHEAAEVADWLRGQG